MAEFPAFPLWTDAYLADTGELSTVEHGAYLLLLIAMWRAGGSLPDDQHRLMRFARCSQPAQWSKIWVNLKGFFHTSGGTISQGRLGDELDKARSRSKKAAESARAKYRKTLVSGPANAQSEQRSKPATTSITTSTSITIEKEQPSSLRSDTPSAPKATAKSELMVVLDEEHATDVIEHRTKIKKPMTAKAAKMLAMKLGQSSDPNRSADLMIEKSWSGFDVEWERNLVRGSPQHSARPLTRIEQMQEDLRRRIADEQANEDRARNSDLEAVERFPRLTLEHHGGRS